MLEETDYTQHITSAINSYNIVVSHRTEANLTDEQKKKLTHKQNQ